MLPQAETLFPQASLDEVGLLCPRGKNHHFPLGSRTAFLSSNCTVPFPSLPPAAFFLDPANPVCSNKRSPARPEKAICRGGLRGLREQGLDCDSPGHRPREGLK